MSLKLGSGLFRNRSHRVDVASLGYPKYLDGAKPEYIGYPLSPATLPSI